MKDIYFEGAESVPVEVHKTDGSLLGDCLMIGVTVRPDGELVALCKRVGNTRYDPSAVMHVRIDSENKRYTRLRRPQKTKK